MTKQLSTFERLDNELAKRKTLTASDVMGLMMLADAFDEWQQLTELLKSQGSTYAIETKSGGTMYRQRPEYQQANDAFKRWIALAKEYGITPRSRKMIDQIDDGGDSLNDLMTA